MKELFIYVLSINGILFAFSIIFYFFQPKKINSIYGYRTKRTMNDNAVWSFANKFFAKQFMRYSGIFFAFTSFMYMLNPISWLPWVMAGITILASIIKTEQELNKFYDKDGNKLK